MLTGKTVKPKSVELPFSSGRPETEKEKTDSSEAAHAL